MDSFSPLKNQTNEIVRMPCKSNLNISQGGTKYQPKHTYTLLLQVQYKIINSMYVQTKTIDFSIKAIIFFDYLYFMSLCLNKMYDVSQEV